MQDSTSGKTQYGWCMPQWGLCCCARLVYALVNAMHIMAGLCTPDHCSRLAGVSTSCTAGLSAVLARLVCLQSLRGWSVCSPCTAGLCHAAGTYVTGTQEQPHMQVRVPDAKGQRLVSACCGAQAAASGHLTVPRSRLCRGVHFAWQCASG